MNSCTVALLVVFGVSVIFASPPQFRIVGGNEAKPHEFPFLVSLTLVGTEANNCGGAILSERWILTAGHCIYQYDEVAYYIIAGKHDLSVKEPGQQIRSGKKFIAHPDFDIEIVGPNDIGLIYLSEPLEFSETVQPVALPERESIPKGLAVVSGWGSTSLGLEPAFTDRLRTAVVPILDYETCAKALKDTTFDRTNLCSGPLAGGVGHCSGDSGGPLVQQVNGKMTIVGVISWAYTPCGSPNTPPAFTRVSHFVGWIHRTMKKYN
uniref:Venom polypeptide n=1 Tax=Dolopus genitalis TaxID=2488630 RepID=A0A3G5BIJ5_DOLGE|nr:venom polypeptide [Dolopus genitalis]